MKKRVCVKSLKDSNMRAQVWRYDLGQRAYKVALAHRVNWNRWQWRASFTEDESKQVLRLLEQAEETISVEKRPQTKSVLARLCRFLKGE